MRSSARVMVRVGRVMRCGAGLVIAAAAFSLVALAPVAAQPFERISRAPDGSDANHRSELPATNADGTVVVFKSLASNLIASDRNGLIDVFLYDRVTGAIERVPRRPDTRDDPLEESYPPVVSDDGRFVAFGSAATNLVRGDFNLFPDAYWYDRATETTRNLSLVLEGREGNLGGRVPDLPPSISADGRLVAFTSASAHIAGIDTNETYDVFVADTETGVTELISSTRLGTTSERAANELSGSAVLSPEGRYVVFCSAATNLTVDQPANREGLFLRDRVEGTTRFLVPVGPRTGFSTAGSCMRREMMAAVSDDAQVIAFTTFYGLDAADTNARLDVYVWRAYDESVTLVSSGPQGPGNGASSFPAISRDGRFVVFHSLASDLTDDLDENGASDIFVADLWENRMARLTGNGDEHRAGDSFNPAISRDGTVVAFQSEAVFTEDDRNGVSDIFIGANRLSFTPTPTQTEPATATPTPIPEASETPTVDPTTRTPAASATPTAVPTTPTPGATATSSATGTAVATSTSVATATTPGGNGGGTATPTQTGNGGGGTPTVTATNVGTPRSRRGDGDGCGCRIDPDTGRSMSSLPLLAFAFPALLVAARRRRSDAV